MLVAIFAGTLFASMGAMGSRAGLGGSFGSIMAFIYLTTAAVSFFSVCYLNRFATKAKRAFREYDAEALTASLGYLKSHYKFIGILMLAILALYALIFVLAILRGLLGG